MSSGSFTIKKAGVADVNGSAFPGNLTGRKVLTPSTMTVTFDGTSPGNKAPPSNSKIDKTKISTNQNIPNKKMEVVENGRKSVSKADVPSSESSNGIRLVGYKMSNENAGTVNGDLANDKQKPWTPLSMSLLLCVFLCFLINAFISISLT